jgi:hypothetical protein
VNTARFVPQHLTIGQKLALLRHWLVDDPQGWAPGSVRYTDADLAALLTPDGRLRPIVLWIGRYQQVKRLNVLLDVGSLCLALRDSTCTSACAAEIGRGQPRVS